MSKPIRQAHDKPKVITVVGPTSSGKSALGVFLARKVGGEIISADSRQVYHWLNLGTGKVTKKEMSGVTHHLLDIVSPKKIFTVSDFVKLAEKVISGLIYQSTPKTPIVVGGTGLYVDALLGRMVIPEAPPNTALRARLEKKTAACLFAMLQKLDPRRAANIEPKHKRRLIRAIEIAKTLGKSPIHKVTLCNYEVLWLGLNPGPEKLQKNIRVRLAARMKAGMVAEAKRLHKNGLSYKRMEQLGLEYRSLAKFLQKKISRTELEKEILRGNLDYAKRQMRWFRRNPEIKWVKNPPGSRAGKNEALRLAKKFLNPKTRTSDVRVLG